jgi:hypothetical protein
MHKSIHVLPETINDHELSLYVFEQALNQNLA